MRLSARERLLLFAPVAVLLGGWLLLPAALGLLATFTTYSPVRPALGFSGVDNYAAILRDREFAAAIRNVVAFAILAVPLELAIGFSLAYLLRRPIRGRRLWRLLLLLPWLVSPIANGVMWHFLFSTTNGILSFVLGWLGQAKSQSPTGNLALALPATIAVEVWRIAPFVAFLILPSLSSIPPERWEDATLEGASLARTIKDVALPSLRPLLLAITMLLIGLALGTFDGVLILTGGGPGTATVMPALYSYERAIGAGASPTGAASAWLLSLGVAAVGLVYLRLARARPQ